MNSECKTKIYIKKSIKEIKEIKELKEIKEIKKLSPIFLCPLNNSQRHVLAQWLA
jgi:hypothetical protein